MPTWFPDWTNDTALVVASGPSATTVPLDLVRGHVKTITTNSSYKLVPWADALCGTDMAWWESVKGAPDFNGIKISRDPQACDRYGDIHRVKLRKVPGSGWCDDMLFDTPGEIGWGGNSGFQAINLAAQFGAKTIVLIGLDATISHGVHWHGRHGGGLHNPTSGTSNGWRIRLDRAARQLERQNVTVLNASPISALTAYRKIDFCEYFGIEQ